jgi:hypothetical protein
VSVIVGRFSFEEYVGIFQFYKCMRVVVVSVLQVDSHLEYHLLGLSIID